MKSVAERNLHVPLPGDLHEELRREAKRSGKPSTALAREAIEAFLRRRRKRVIHEAIAAYAAKEAGGPSDLDPALERAGLDVLMEEDDEE